MADLNEILEMLEDVRECTKRLADLTEESREIEKIRAGLMNQLHEAGTSWREISEVVGLSHSHVMRVCQNYVRDSELEMLREQQEPAPQTFVYDEVKQITFNQSDSELSLEEQVEIYAAKMRAAYEAQTP